MNQFKGHSECGGFLIGETVMTGHRVLRVICGPFVENTPEKIAKEQEKM